jgi:hypothetical protein
MTPAPEHQPHGNAVRIADADSEHNAANCDSHPNRHTNADAVEPVRVGSNLAINGDGFTKPKDE